MNSRTFELGFLALSTVGFVLLWPMMIYNGTLVGLLKAAWNGSFADGSALLTKYTYIWPIDFAISVLVAFFDGQIDGKDNGTWILMFDLLAVLQTAALWVVVEGSRKGNNRTILRLFGMWPLLWNMFGAAFVLSLYFYCHMKITNTSAADPTLPRTRARALTPTMALAAFPPAMVMLLAYSFTSTPGRQSIIAVFQFSPLIVAATVYILCAIPESSSTKPINGDTNSVVYSYVFSGFLAAAAHVYTLCVTLFSNDASVAFGRVFIPHPSQVVSGSVTNVHDGALLFLQYDWIVINLSCALWAYLIMNPTQHSSNSRGNVTQAIVIILLTLIVGPGATVCGALWLSEDNLRKQYVKAQSASAKDTKAYR